RGHRALAHRVGAKGAGAHRRAPRHPRASPVTTARCRVPPSWVPWPMPTVLAVNAGSSSLKFAPLPPGDPPVRRSAGSIDRIGQPAATLTVDGGERGDVTAPDHAAALPMLVDALEARGLPGGRGGAPRVGARFLAPARVSAYLLEELRRISPFDPEHPPAEIALIEACARHFPGRPQGAGL